MRIRRRTLTRREFWKVGLLTSVGLGSFWGLRELGRHFALAETPLDGRDHTFHEARHYQRLKGGKVACQLCPRRCTIVERARGFCRVRENRGGRLYSRVYGLPCAIGSDPVEKKPLYHVLPGHMRLTLATASCNLRCKFCHNWHISQVAPEEVTSYHLSPVEVVQKALAWEVESISFTYTEPTVFYEYMYDIAQLARERGLMALLNSNAYINPQPLEDLLQHIDAFNFDLKGFTEEFYREISSARLGPVLDSLKLVREKGIHLEVINLVIPTLNDNREDIGRMCRWIVDNLGAEVPLHFTRFFPSYKLSSLPPTPIETLERARQIACQAGLHYVYIGNVPGHQYDNTYCPACGKLLIGRLNLTILCNHVEGGRCRYCGHKLPGIWRGKSLSPPSSDRPDSAP